MKVRLFAILMAVCAVPLGAQVCSTPYSGVIQPIHDADDTQNPLAYDDVVASWFTGEHALIVRTCPNGVDQCLLVPKYVNSSECAIDSGKCGWPNATPMQGCQVTDELSQVGMALAMSSDTTHFAEWFNTVKAILVAVDDTTDQLPAWMQTIDWTNAQVAMANSSTDDASDATARIIIALYIAGEREARYLDLGNRLAAAFARHDYVRKAITARNRAIGNWLASGWMTAKGHPDVVCNGCTEKFGYAGYYGDAAMAMLAAYMHTGDDAYLALADDTVENYLTAAAWSPGAFRVPPTAFSWGASMTTKCLQDCGTYNGEDAWDDADAPRAVSLCKLAYYEQLAGVTVNADVQSYCGDWMATHALSYGAATFKYNKRFSVSGTKIEPDGVLDSYVNNALGTYLNFFCGTDELRPRLQAVFDKYHRNAQLFDGDQCFGVYTQAFPIIEYGSALGLDRAAFTTRAALDAAASATSVSISWTQIPGASAYELWRRDDTHPWASFTLPQTSYIDHPPAGIAYLYRVRGVFADGSRSPFSNADLAVPFAFTDDPLVAQSTSIKAVHVSELRSAVDAVQRTAAIAPAAYTDAVLTSHVTTVRAMHITELRNRLDAARLALGLPALTYAHSVAAGAQVRATDVSELRGAMR